MKQGDKVWGYNDDGYFEGIIDDFDKLEESQYDADGELFAKKGEIIVILKEPSTNGDPAANYCRKQAIIDSYTNPTPLSPSGDLRPRILKKNITGVCPMMGRKERRFKHDQREI